MTTKRTHRSIIELLENRTLMSAATLPVVQADVPFGFDVTSLIYSGEVASFSNIPQPVIAGLEAVIHWGDGTKSMGTIIPNTAAGTIDVYGSHEYGTNIFGTIPAKIVLWENAPGLELVSSTYSNGQFTIPSPQGITTQFSQVLGTSFAGMLGRFDVPTSQSETEGFMIREVSVNWGDGKSSGAILQADPNGGTDVFGQHTYSSVGYYEITVTVTDVPAPSGGVVLPLELGIANFNTAVDETGMVKAFAFTANPTTTFNTAAKISDSALSSVLD